MRICWIEITKTCRVAFMKAKNSLFDVERNMSIGKKTEDGENLFLKTLANRFWLTSKSFHGSAKLFMADLLSSGLYEKVMMCY